MSLRFVVVALLTASACGPAESDEQEFTPPEFVQVSSYLTDRDLTGSSEAEVREHAGEPCSEILEHTDSHVTISRWLYCAEDRCSEDCYWHVRVYFENGKVSYTRSRRPPQ